MIYKLGNTLSLRNPKIIEANIILFDSIQFNSTASNKKNFPIIQFSWDVIIYRPGGNHPQIRGGPGAQAFPYVLLITA
jgi:hypothetical protein